MTYSTAKSTSRRVATAFTLIEAVMSILVVGLMLVAVLNTLGASKLSQMRNTEQSLGPMLAQDLMTEILNQHYMEPATTGTFGLEGENATVRTDWDDVDDYDGWSSTPPQDRNGTDLPGMDGWGRKVTVTWADAADLNSTSGSANGIKRIDVTVTHNGQPITTLSSLRTSGWPDKTPVVNVLLVVIDSASLTSQEQLRQTLMESWGFVVEPITASDSQTAFDDAAARNDVVYVCEAISSGDLNTKLLDATIGVVCEEPYLDDEFGFTDTFELYDKKKVYIVDNSHFITEGFAVDKLEILSSNSELSRIIGGLGGGVDVLAQTDHDDEHVLVVIETGRGLFGGGVAAGRRVQLPWGGGSFDGSLLNDDGKLLMKRAIAWAADKEEALDVP